MHVISTVAFIRVHIFFSWSTKVCVLFYKWSKTISFFESGEDTCAYLFAVDSISE